MKNATKPWSVDRWGRLIAGGVTLILTLLAMLHNPLWLFGTLFLGANLIIGTLIDRCPVHDLLVRLNAKEREDLFLPGGAIRPSVITDKEIAALRSESVNHTS